MERSDQPGRRVFLLSQPFPPCSLRGPAPTPYRPSSALYTPADASSLLAFGQYKYASPALTARPFSSFFTASVAAMLPTTLLAAFLPLLGYVLAQDDGSVTGPTSSASAAGYSCDATKCKLPDCNCASTDPPGGLSPVSSLIS